MAVECALENSIASLIGPLFMTNLAKAFNFEFPKGDAGSKSIPAATTLGQAMAAARR